MIKAALIGAGNRGKDAYGKYALSHPHEIKFVAVAEPNAERRHEFAKQHCIPDNMVFESWEQLLDKPQLSDVIFICTQDRMHYKPTMMALEKGYNVLLEKPMATDIKECIDMVKKAKEKNKILTVTHVLRYTPFFSKIKELIDSGKIGEIVTINLNENVGYWHFAHSFVRGNWRNSETSCPVILAKSCHDMDLLAWLIGKKPQKISSFGSLKYFKKENAPANSGERCLDCKIENECPYSAVKLYLGENIGWPVSVISSDLSIEGRIKALKEGPYGRCVFKCDNNVADHQNVSIEFEDGIIANFTLSAFTTEISREIKIMGTKGVIEGKLENNVIEVTMFGNGEKEVLTPATYLGGHSGGDYGLMKYFIKQIAENIINGVTSGEVTIISHVMAFAAEESRVSNKTINIDEYLKKYNLTL